MKKIKDKYDLMIDEIERKRQLEEIKQEEHKIIVDRFISSALNISLNGKQMFKLVDKRSK